MENKTEQRDRQLSRFRRSLIKALDGSDLSELHLFAISLVIQLEQCLCPDLVGEVHIRGFEALLRYLIRKNKHLKESNDQLRPHDLIGYLLVYTRTLITWRMLSLDTSSKRAGYELLRSLGELSPYFELPSTASDPRIAFSFLRPSRRNQDQYQFSGLVTALCEVETHLYLFVLETFSIEITGPGRAEKATGSGSLLRLAKSRLEMMENLPEVKELFLRVEAPSTFELTMQIRRSDFEYIKSYFHEVESFTKKYLGYSALILVLASLLGDKSHDADVRGQAIEIIDAVSILRSLDGRPCPCIPISLLLSNIFSWDLTNGSCNFRITITKFPRVEAFEGKVVDPLSGRLPRV
jgi:hypothetical protein